MNKQRRRQIAALVNRFEELRGLADDLRADIDAIATDETAAYDGLPEGIQNGARGDTMQAACDTLEQARDGIDELDDAIDQITALLQEAAA